VADDILIIEDDDRIRLMLRLALVDEGYAVREASSGESGVEQMRIDPAGMVIVDLMLGGIDGFTCIREIRHNSDAPIIIVSARSDTHDIVTGLEAGADDYVTKPFQIKEITARLRALRRRSGRPDDAAATGAPDVVLARHAAGNLVLSTAAGTVRRGDQDLHLTITEFRVLCELAAMPGQVLSRSSLLERVWDHGFFGDERLVDVHIRRLRRKIEADPGRPLLVVTVRGLGYRLDLP
jgi:DNA-binding response OmpR family regulator